VWFDFKLSWWCDDCRKKHIPKMADVLKKVNGRVDNVQNQRIGQS
jgi:hypothetical protein